MTDYKYSVKNTTKLEREKLRSVALSYSNLDALEPSKETMKLVDAYVDGTMEIADALEIVLEKYRKSGMNNAGSIFNSEYKYFER